MIIVYVIITLIITCYHRDMSVNDVSLNIFKTCVKFCVTERYVTCRIETRNARGGVVTSGKKLANNFLA